MLLSPVTMCGEVTPAAFLRAMPERVRSVTVTLDKARWAGVSVLPTRPGAPGLVAARAAPDAFSDPVAELLRFSTWVRGNEGDAA